MDGLSCEVEPVRMADYVAADMLFRCWQRPARILPGDDVPVVLQDQRGRRLGRMRWGWRNGDQTSLGRQLVVQRADQSVGRSPRAWNHGRCAILVTAFYFWELDSGDRPSANRGLYAVRCGLRALAALWKTEGHDDVASPGVLLLAGRSSENLAALHPLQPMWLLEDDLDPWLERDTPHRVLRAMMNRAIDHGAPIRVHPMALSPAYSGDPLVPLKDLSEFGPSGCLPFNVSKEPKPHR